MKVLKLKDFDIQDWLDTPFQEDAYLPDFLMKMVFLHHRFLNHNNLYPLAIVFFFFRLLLPDDYRQNHFKINV